MKLLIHPEKKLSHYRFTTQNRKNPKPVIFTVKMMTQHENLAAAAEAAAAAAAAAARSRTMTHPENIISSSRHYI